MRISAVSYLNTWPLVWGFLHGPQRGIYEFQFDLPSGCADALEAGEVDMGLVPCAELDRLELEYLPQLGIACEGPVRSILLVSKVPFQEIRTLAADSGSRTSVALARIILAERYGCQPLLQTEAPRLETMLADCDAALLIGDPALHLEPEKLPYRWLDLGAEWVKWTGLPMVFAVWAGRPRAVSAVSGEAFVDSYGWGREHMEEIVARAAAERCFPAPLARAYLTGHIVYELAEPHWKGLELFRRLIRS